jgi:hypothetical protein
MNSYRQQVKDEKAELDERLFRLQAFLDEDPPDTVDDAERRRMMEQARVMADYSAILKSRIAAFSS